MPCRAAGAVPMPRPIGVRRGVRSRIAAPLGTNGHADESESSPHSLQMNDDEDYAPVDFWTALFRGGCGRCPRCGQGAPFGRFLKMQSHCPACNQALEPDRADGAPAYFTILVVGHIVVPLVLIVER